jgi:hypothetical protein
VLLKEFRQWIEQAVPAANEPGAASPEEWPAPEARLKALLDLLKSSPDVFSVTPEQEREFAGGAFAEASAADALERAIKRLNDRGTALPWICRYVVEQFQAGKLKGARLEAAARVLTEFYKRTVSVPALWGRLEFRIAAQRGEGPAPRLGEEAVARYLADLGANGPEAGHAPQGPFGWYQTSGAFFPGPPPMPANFQNLITGSHHERVYVLLSNQPRDTMLTAWGDSNPWRIKNVAAGDDGQGHWVINLELDEEGGRRFAALTETHLNQRLAVLVDDQVLSVPTIRSKITDKLQITGNFSKEEVKGLVAALMDGMTPLAPTSEPARNAAGPLHR